MKSYRDNVIKRSFGVSCINLWSFGRQVNEIKFLSKIYFVLNLQDENIQLFHLSSMEVLNHIHRWYESYSEQKRTIFRISLQTKPINHAFTRNTSQTLDNV